MKIKVRPEESGITLLAFLRSRYPAMPSVRALKRWIEKKGCRVNGRLETFSTHPLRDGDEVVLEQKEDPIKPLQLLWEDAALLAYDKPPGIVSDFSPNLVHRLDKETSGVLLVAKSQKVLQQMVELFSQKKVAKTYLAVVDKVVKKENGTICSYLAPVHRWQGQTLYASCERGKLAETRWEKVAIGEKASLLKCHPITGRTHQIRVHLKELGHPIRGDTLYANVCAHRLLLHAYTLAFPHPLTGEMISLTAPVPLDFSQELKKLGISCDF